MQGRQMNNMTRTNSVTSVRVSACVKQTWHLCTGTHETQASVRVLLHQTKHVMLAALRRNVVRKMVVRAYTKPDRSV